MRRGDADQTRSVEADSPLIQWCPIQWWMACARLRHPRRRDKRSRRAMAPAPPIPRTRGGIRRACARMSRPAEIRCSSGLQSAAGQYRRSARSPVMRTSIWRRSRSWSAARRSTSGHLDQRRRNDAIDRVAVVEGIANQQTRPVLHRRGHEIEIVAQTRQKSRTREYRSAEHVIRLVCPLSQRHRLQPPPPCLSPDRTSYTAAWQRGPIQYAGRGGVPWPCSWCTASWCRRGCRESPPCRRDSR